MEFACKEGLLLLLTFVPVLLIADTSGILPQSERPAEAE